jgi:hypothetical protein
MPRWRIQLVHTARGNAPATDTICYDTFLNDDETVAVVYDEFEALRRVSSISPTLPTMATRY